MRPALPGPNSQRNLPVRQAPRPPSKAVMPGEPAADKAPLVVVLLVVGAALLHEFWPHLRQALDQGSQVWQDFTARLESQQQTAAPAAVTQEQHPEAVQPLPAAPTSTPAAPDVLQQIAESAPSLLQGPLNEVVNLSSEGMEVELGPAGQVLITSKYSIQRLGAGNPHDRQVLFSSAIYREQFPHSRLQAMASALALPDGRYLFGGWHGEVLLWTDGRLQRLADGSGRPKGRIADLQVWGDEILLAGDGLWRVLPGGAGLQEIPLPGLRRIRALGLRPGRLLLADDGRGIHEWNGSRVQPWLSLPEDAGHIEMIQPARDGGWWIGSSRGLYRASDDGQQLETVLAGIWVTSLAERPDELWVGSWKQGLLLWRSGAWHRLGSGIGGLAVESVSGLVVDARDHLWLTLYGGGGWQASLQSLRDVLQRRPWTPAPDEP